ncbi:hypothetical protein RHS04_09039 [Rhizoctonia solani]|uniref:Ricin B lectin domain-containing protein n=1 Tax=Rhizoctonia solani TaxID=456999 RepID=A0A8H7H014_9AGAM|nr:hypothetical protein RHS04_09039 [Rhizoctonia solani]
MASSTPTTSQPTFASGVYKLKNVATGTLLDLWNGETNEGTIIQAPTANVNADINIDFQWHVEWTGTANQLTLRNFKSGTYFGAGPSGIQNGSAPLGSATAVPVVLVVADKGYAIEPVADRGVVLDLQTNSSANRVPVRIPIFSYMYQRAKSPL